MFRIMADSCLGNKHLFIHLFMQENSAVLKLIAKQITFRNMPKGTMRMEKTFENPKM